MELAENNKGRLESPPVNFGKHVKSKGIRNYAYILHTSTVARNTKFLKITVLWQSDVV
jgi:hypothetical protein